MLHVLTSLCFAANAGPSPSGFVHLGGPDSERLLTVDGQTAFRFVGCNIGWLMEEAAHHRERATRALDHVATSGLTVVRTWAFGNGLFRAPGELDDRWASALDFVIHEAQKRGLRLILPLLGYGEDNGGLRYMQHLCLAQEGADYVEGWKASDGGCPRFYMSLACRELYVKHANMLLRRTNHITGVEYRNDPTIMAWEVCAGCRCAADNTATSPAPTRRLQPTATHASTSWTEPGGAALVTRNKTAPHAPPQDAAPALHGTLHDWISFAAAAVKAIAPKQLVSAGSEGFYSA